MPTVIKITESLPKDNKCPFRYIYYKDKWAFGWAGDLATAQTFYTHYNFIQTSEQLSSSPYNKIAVGDAADKGRQNVSHPYFQTNT